MHILTINSFRNKISKRDIDFQGKDTKNFPLGEWSNDKLHLH